MVYYNRDIFCSIKKVLEREEIIILTGARQTGKTSLLMMLKDFLKEKNESTYYLNLENPEYLTALNKHPYNIFDLIPATEAKQYVFIDEIQYLKNPSNFLKLLYDEKKSQLKIIASGSSAFYIDRKFKDSLSGRKFMFEIFPLNFNEFIDFNGQKSIFKRRKQKLSSYYHEKLMKLWNDYLFYGGYPGVVLEKDNEIKKILLEDIGTAYIKKDIVEAGIKNTDKYFLLIKILASQTGALLNTHEIANTLNLSYKTVEEYLYVMKKSYLLAFISPFYNNRRKELTKMPKVYFYDIGLRNFFLNNYQPIDKRVDKGEYLENIVFKELLKKTGCSDKIKFWRTQDKKEVDFVVDDFAFEIKFSKKNIKENKYARFKETYPEISLKILEYKDILEEFYGWKLDR